MNDYKLNACDGMSARVVSTQCLDEVYATDRFGDVSDIFSYAYKVANTAKNLRLKFPAIAGVDEYGHTAMDGLSYDQLVEKDLPRLRELATDDGADDIALRINKLLDFITKHRERGDHQLLIFDGA